jgi:hypothetical protein
VTKFERKMLLKAKRSENFKKDLDKFFAKPDSDEIQSPSTNDIGAWFSLKYDKDELVEIKKPLQVINVSDEYMRISSVEFLKSINETRKNLKRIVTLIKHSPDSGVERLFMTSIRLVIMLRQALKNFYMVIMRESVSDEVLEELPKGEYYMKIFEKSDFKKSDFKNPKFKFKLRHDPDKISTGTSKKYNTTIKNSQQVFHISIILLDIIRKWLKGAAI